MADELKKVVVAQITTVLKPTLIHLSVRLSKATNAVASMELQSPWPEMKEDLFESQESLAKSLATVREIMNCEREEVKEALEVFEDYQLSLKTILEKVEVACLPFPRDDPAQKNLAETLVSIGDLSSTLCRKISKGGYYD